MKKLIALLMAAAMLLSLAACGGAAASAAEASAPAAEASAPAAETSAAEAPAAPAATGDTVEAAINADGIVDCNGADLSGMTIGYVTISDAAPWGGLVGTSFAEYAQSVGATVNSMSAQTEASKVTEYAQNMIATGVDALVIFGGDPVANGEIAKECKDAGIGLFMAGLDVADGYQEYTTACVGPDQEQMTYDIAQKAIEVIGKDSGAIVCQINGVPFLDDYIQRVAGFARGTADTNWTLLEPVDCYSDRAAAQDAMTNTLASNPDVNVVMGFDDDLTMGAVQVIQEKKLGDQIKVFSLTGQNDAIQAVADGQMELTVVNRASDIGAELVNAISEWKATGATAYYHRTPLTFVTAENVNEWIGKGEF